MRVLGTMSGTSLDGVDVAALVTDGQRVLEFGPSHFRPYEPAEQEVLRAALGQWPGGADVRAATELVEDAHAQALARLGPADLIGFHGQTLAHDPGGRGTHQIGSGQVLGALFATPIVWDFRSTDVSMGGQGAPLAPFYHFALAQGAGLVAPTAFLNLGGVGNLTWADPRAGRPEDPGALLAFDTGPANAPINDLIQARRGLPFDENGALAAQGDVDAALVARFLKDSYFAAPAPKSLDRDAFAYLAEATASLPDADACATLAACAAASVARGLDLCPEPPAQMLVAGGGRKNARLMEMLAGICPCDLRPIEEIGVDGDMVEAQAFAFLAARVISGLPTSAPGTTGVAGAVAGGKIWRP